MSRREPAPAEATARNPAPDLELFLDRRKRVCLACGMELPKGFVAACGLKRRCPYCEHPYPLGDCAD